MPNVLWQHTQLQTSHELRLGIPWNGNSHAPSAPSLLLERPHSRGLALMMVMGVSGLSFLSVCTMPRRFITPIPVHTRPKMVCLPSSQGVGARVMKNCRQEVGCDGGQDGGRDGAYSPRQQQLHQ